MGSCGPSRSSEWGDSSELLEKCLPRTEIRTRRRRVPLFSFRYAGRSESCPRNHSEDSSQRPDSSSKRSRGRSFAPASQSGFKAREMRESGFALDARNVKAWSRAGGRREVADRGSCRHSPWPCPGAARATSRAPAEACRSISPWPTVMASNSAFVIVLGRQFEIQDSGGTERVFRSHGRFHGLIGSDIRAMSIALGGDSIGRSQARRAKFH